MYNFTDDIKTYPVKTDYRYERKFAISGIFGEDIELILRNHQAFFKEIFKERFINNIYFDTPDLKFYFDNITGKSQRKKYRIRWYNKLFGKVVNPILEVKIKNGLLGTKESYPLNPFIFKGNENLSSVIKECLSESILPEKIKEEMSVLFPTLLNRYKRKYFTDFSKKFRATIDTCIEYYSVVNKFSPSNHNTHENVESILELKYLKEFNKNVSAISSQFPFRMTKNSKYVNGIEIFYNV